MYEFMLRASSSGFQVPRLWPGHSYFLKKPLQVRRVLQAIEQATNLMAA